MDRRRDDIVELSTKLPYGFDDTCRSLGADVFRVYPDGGCTHNCTLDRSPAHLWDASAKLGRTSHRSRYDILYDWPAYPRDSSRALNDTNHGVSNETGGLACDFVGGPYRTANGIYCSGACVGSQAASATQRRSKT